MRQRSAVLTHAGRLRFEAVTGTGRKVVFGDEAGIGEHSPVELLATAVAACTATDVVSIMAKKRQVIETYSVRVDAEQRDEYPQVLTRIEIVHELSGPRVTEADVRRSIELSATKYCPVSAMLSAGATEIHHRYRVRGTGAEPFEAEGEVAVTGPYRRPEIVAELA